MLLAVEAARACHSAPRRALAARVGAINLLPGKLRRN